MSEFVKTEPLGPIDSAARDTTIARAIAEVRRRGPDRVLIDEYETISSMEATGRYKNGTLKEPIALFFIRNDGWTLGTPYSLAGVAQRMFSGEWLTVLTLDEIMPPYPKVEKKDDLVVGTIEEVRKAFGG